MAVASVAVAFLALPLVGLLQRAPWTGLGRLLGERDVLDALRVSLTVSVVAAVVVLLLGTPLAWALARAE